MTAYYVVFTVADVVQAASHTLKTRLTIPIGVCLNAVKDRRFQDYVSLDEFHELKHALIFDSVQQLKDNYERYRHVFTHYHQLAYPTGFSSNTGAELEALYRDFERPQSNAATAKECEV